MTATALDEGVVSHDREGTWATIRRGLRLTPQLRVGLRSTLLLALVATAGRMVIPVAVQQTLDRGLRPDGTVDLPVVRLAVFGAAVAVVLTGAAGYLTTLRLARTTEDALAHTRVRTFRHIHDLSMLHQAAERRGTLVSRVTSDVDSISQFMQWGGILLIISTGQLLLATALMLHYSPLLTLVVLASFVPLVALLRWTNPRLGERYGLVRVRVGETLGAVAESVVGASVIRAYGVEARTAQRVDGAIERLRDAQARAAWLNTTMFSTGEIFAAVAMAAVLAVGLLTGVDGDLSRGRLVAFLFLVSLFVQPVQTATEVLNEAQTAVAGWRRVLDVLDTEPDVADPARAGRGVDLPRGPLEVRFDRVGFAYPGGPPVLHDVDLVIPPQTRVAVVGETGSGKTTFAKLLTRLMDPTTGEVLLGGVQLRDVAFSSLRRRVVVVPQDGFLFDLSIADNVRHGHPDATEAQLVLAFTELGLADWLEGLPHGLDTRVGERGESLSSGERQLVALARAYVANPDLLVLDEATSAVDPVTEVRLSRALDGITRGRTTVTIAHRLSTAEVADEVIVFEQGRVVQRGPHAELLVVPGRYAELYAGWTAQRR